MVVSRRKVMRSLGAGALTAGLLSACGDGPIRGRGGRRRRTTTAPTPEDLTMPDETLSIGSIGQSHGKPGRFEKEISTALRLAMIQINVRWGGLFGREVEVRERHVIEKPGEDLDEVVSALAESGVTAVVLSVDEETLLEAIPLCVEAGIAMIDVFTSGMVVRRDEVSTSNMLVRLSPNDRALAAEYVQQALSGGGGERAGEPGTVFYVSEDTEQGDSLLTELSQLLRPQGGSVVGRHVYGPGNFGAVDGVVTKILEAPPALLVVNGPAAEAGPLLSALYAETLDDDGRPTVQIPVRLSPDATTDYTEAELAPDALSSATGYAPGAIVDNDLRLDMLNEDANFQHTLYAYAQQTYDAPMLAALAATQRRGVSGQNIAQGIPQVLAGATECKDYGACRQVLINGISTGNLESVKFPARSGTLELGGDLDPQVSQIREYSWSGANEIVAGDATNLDLGD